MKMTTEDRTWDAIKLREPAPLTNLLRSKCKKWYEVGAYHMTRWEQSNEELRIVAKFRHGGDAWAYASSLRMTRTVTEVVIR